VTIPIVALAAASFGVVLISLWIGAREADNFALSRQRQTIEHALKQHGHSLSRELLMQTVWTEAYEKTHARDNAWMKSYYGAYLSDLLGYDGVYVLGPNDSPIFGYAPLEGIPSDYALIGEPLADLVQAVRTPQSLPADYDVITTDVPLANGTVLHHKAVADVRSIDGRPSTVVASTIVPDRGYTDAIDAPPMILVAIEEIDPAFTSQLGHNFGFKNLKWVTDGKPAGDASEVVKSLAGASVGTMAWRKDRPGLEFIHDVAPGLLLAMMLVAALTGLLVNWGDRQAQRILESERDATLAARTDTLTGLPNRVALREEFPQFIAAARRTGSTLAVLSIDIDQFKAINDVFGNAVGDAVLKATARRLQGIAPTEALVARLDGDRFVILAPGLDELQIDELANDVIATLAAPFDLDSGTRIFIASSLGYAIGLRDGSTGDELMRRAELAVDKAKSGAAEIAVAFTPNMEAEVTYRLMLEAALRNSVGKGEIDVAYQPLMDPCGRRVLGVEALARWTDPELGPISPEIFIPLAEEAGLIQKIGEIVMRRAVETGAAWPGITIAVNVSAAQIHHGDVVEVVRNVISGAEFPPERLEIEITESVLLADEKRANEQMRGLQRLGARIALDDFGTGYSSLQYLQRFGFDKLKIDRSFIDRAGDPLGSSVVLASIIKLGQDLGLRITAEGVETEEQRRWLQSAGCHELQGYLFSRPLTAEQMTAFIAAHRANRAVAS
jgi:diguanylate cyclase (GGDEF)-like protein